MVKRQTRRRLTKQMLYLLLCAGVIFFQILPVSTVPRNWAGPDLLFAITYAWVIRRPDYVPIVLVVVVFFVADIIFYRPPGLWCLLVVIAIIVQKMRWDSLSSLTLPAEFSGFVIVLLTVNIGYRFILSIFFIENTPLALTTTQIVSTVIAYPVVAVLTHYFFGVRQPKLRDIAA